MAKKDNKTKNNTVTNTTKSETKTKEAANRKDKQIGIRSKKNAPPTIEQPQHSFKLLIVICNHGKAEEITDILHEQDVHFNTVCMGIGTAESMLENLLGLGDSEKDIILSIVETSKVEMIMKVIHDLYRGSGIAFTVRLNSIGGRNTIKLLNGEFFKNLNIVSGGSNGK